jgi:hypothetical protein
VELDGETDPHLEALIEPGETIRHRTRATRAILAVTDRRIIVAAPYGIALDLPLAALRRVQFDIERDRPATLVLVPDQPRHEPQVLAIPPEEYAAAAEVLVAVGHDIRHK